MSLYAKPTLEIVKTTSHCVRCGRILLADVKGDICLDCICAGMRPFRNDLKKIIRGLGDARTTVKTEMILNGLRSINKGKSEQLCGTCIACCFFAQVKNLRKNTPIDSFQFFSNMTILKKILWEEN